MAFDKFLCIAVGGTKEKYVDIFQRKFIGKSQITFSVESFVYIGNLITGITAAVDKYYFCLGVVDKQADKFTRRISCSTNNSCFYHNS